MNEQALWQAVILQAFQDAEITPYDSYTRFVRDQAKAWFNMHSADFHTVCSYAGYSPRYVFDTFHQRMVAA